MRKHFIIKIAYVSLASIVASVAFAQVQDRGWVDIGSKKETQTAKKPVGSIYKGTGFAVFVGKPPKPYLQHDMGSYELDPAPQSDKNKLYNHRDLAGTWESLPGSSHGSLSTWIPPMTPLGYEMLDERIVATGPRAYLSETRQQNEPELTCDPVGWPLVVFGTVRPMEMIPIPGRLLQHWAWHEQWRTIWLDGRLLPDSPDPAWVGYSTGKWIGDTLIADTVGVDHRAWLDELGSPHSDNAEMQERWRRTDHNTLQLNLTLKDPEVYTETWEAEPVLFQLYPNLELDHMQCVPSEELTYRANSPTETHDIAK